jgi:hypothetical protein
LVRIKISELFEVEEEELKQSWNQNLKQQEKRKLKVRSLRRVEETKNPDVVTGGYKEGDHETIRVTEKKEVMSIVKGLKPASK